ncbi:HAMP domain-containing sensor histidine kinase [Paucibacter sp. PLA-PC-4]|uniref:sensor histidine kinase n=1 Tax=Paucibacter sp. PLA-PC-4 TaxID=2993655 RepID=UPI00224B3CF7|nr:HAMP domain-containing sensor histidine kinase [Paucibacter sp. PLA-PC-4]MCX2864806.1 HAMP domain-containing sensor histidine kinase [Paucibacter sp. PLA-PC-4]
MRRSLATRLVGTLLLAFALISLLILFQNFWSLRQQQTEQSQAAQLGGLLSQTLAALADEDSARLALQGFMGEYAQLRREMNAEVGPVSVQLLRADGRPVFRSDPQQADPAWPAGLSRQVQGERALMVYVAKGPRWTLRVLEPLPGDAQLLRWLIEQIGPSLLMALPLLALPIWLAVRSGLRPLRDFTARVSALDTRRDLQALDLDLRYAELQPLARVLDELLARLRERLAHERAFVHDAAHELRTPLAALGAQAHLLLHSPDEPGRQAAAQALQQDVQRTAHLSQQLLDLAAMDPAHSGATAETLDLSELCGLVLRQAYPQARQRGVQLSLEGPDQLRWQGDRRALHSLLQNLVDNALRYGARAVELQLHDAPTGPLLAVRDDGPGIATEHQALMFERFWRGSQREEPGTGLGLAIVRQAVERLGAGLRCGPGLQGRGIGFELSLPQRRL